MLVQGLRLWNELRILKFYCFRSTVADPQNQNFKMEVKIPYKRSLDEPTYQCLEGILALSRYLDENYGCGNFQTNLCFPN